MKKTTPFHVRRKIQFPWRPTSDRAFIFPCPPPKKIGSIFIPDFLQEEFNEGFGVLLAIGPGFYDDKGRWRPTPEDLVPGVLVKYDETVPWKQVVTSPKDGKDYVVVLCGATDISGIIDE